MISDHLSRAYGTASCGDTHWYIASLMVHFIEETDQRVKTFVASSLMTLYISPDTVIELPLNFNALKIGRLNVRRHDSIDSR